MLMCLKDDWMAFRVSQILSKIHYIFWKWVSLSSTIALSLHKFNLCLGTAHWPQYVPDKTTLVSVHMKVGAVFGLTKHYLIKSQNTDFCPNVADRCSFEEMCLRIWFPVPALCGGPIALPNLPLWIKNPSGKSYILIHAEHENLGLLN